MIRKRVVLSGRVQGVFFRDSCQQAALLHKVAGWVTNRSDGSVEAVFEGTDDAVREMVEWVRGSERIGPGSGGSMRLRSSRPLLSYAYGRVPAMPLVGRHAIDQQKQTLAPDPGPKPSVPRS